MNGFVHKGILKSLLDISNFTNFVENPQIILNLIIEECVLLTKARWGIFVAFDGNADLDTVCFTKPLSEKQKEAIVFNLENFFNKHYREEDKLIFDEQFWKKKRLIKVLKDDVIGKNAKDVLLNPIKRKKKFLALIIVIDKIGKERFTSKDKENLSIMCQEVSLILENIDLVKAKIRNERMAAIGETIAGISHYIKNILQGITAGSYLLNTGIKEKDIKLIEDAWRTISKNTGRISDLVMDMLYYSGERRLQKDRLNPEELIRDVIELIQPRLNEKGIKFESSIKDLPMYIMANYKGLHRSLLNLLGNAIEACDKTESIVKLNASFQESDRTLRIIISDNGKGISNKERDRIFQPFYTNKKGRGTGLGLAITKKVIEEHGGLLRVFSELSKGTSFEISIPV